MDTLEQFEKLKKYDTPTITNVVATYREKSTVWDCMILGRANGTRIRH